MSKNVCKVAINPKNGLLITPKKNNPDWGTVRLDQEITVISNNVFSKRRRSAFIAGKIEDIKANFTKEGQIVPGIIQRQISERPFYEGQAKVVNPSTGEELNYYQQFMYTSDVNAPTDIAVSNLGEESSSGVLVEEEAEYAEN